MNTKRERRQVAFEIFKRFKKIEEKYDEKPKDSYGKTLTFPRTTRKIWIGNFKKAEENFINCNDNEECVRYYNVLKGLDRVLYFVENYDTGKYIGIDLPETGKIKDFVENSSGGGHERMEPLTLWLLAKNYEYLPVANPYNNNSFGYYY